MTYPNREKQQIAEQDRKKRYLTQARIYDSVESFEEYRIKCAACVVSRRISAFGFVDPFWFYYKVNDIGQIKTVLIFDIPLLLASSFATAICVKMAAWPSYVSIIGGSILGFAIWPICLFAVKIFYDKAETLLRYVAAEKRGIKI